MRSYRLAGGLIAALAVAVLSGAVGRARAGTRGGDRSVAGGGGSARGPVVRGRRDGLGRGSGGAARSAGRAPGAAGRAARDGRGAPGPGDAAAEAMGGDAMEEPTFRVYGFIDMGLQKLWSNTDDPSTPTRKTTFVLGNINLYFDFRPIQSWSSLVEVRFTAYPRGEESPGIPALGRPYERLDTSVYDPGIGPGTDTVRWGSIVLERAYIQWHKLDWLGLRVGQFFTPYGIWNVDHGTPTLIGMYRPKSVVNQI